MTRLLWTGMLWFVAALSCTVAPPFARAQDEPDPNQPTVYRLEVTAAAEPDPALAYTLYPRLTPLHAGNAAPRYYRALLLLPKISDQEETERIEQWQQMPLDQLPREEIAKWLDQRQSVWRELAEAVTCESCDFGLRIKEATGPSVYQLLLPEFQELRQLARVLRIKSRWEIREGRFDDAIATLQWGYRLAHDIAQPETIINSLIGVAIASLMNESVREWIDAPNSPNLYWALASMPQPLVDMRPALQHELSMPLRLFPFLEGAETAQYPPREWQRLFTTAMQELSSLAGGSQPQDANSRQLLSGLAVTGLMLRGYPLAKAELIRQGLDAARVEAMPVGQVAAIHSSRLYRRLYHDSMKWTLLPFWQAYEPMIATTQQQGDQFMGGPSGEILPIAALLLPATYQTFQASARLERDLAALMAVEALRLFSARHGGQLPADLAELRDSPAPHDPHTGQPFLYRRDDDRAILELPLVVKQLPRSLSNKIFEITIRPLP